MNKYNQRRLTDIIYNAMNHFNETMNFDISPKNTVIEFFTRETGLVVYEKFCSKYFPDWVSNNYKNDGYFESFAASAFLNDNIYGILIRSNLNWSESEYFNVILHEISHLYCCKNEVEGGNFFNKYCLRETDVDIGVINAGSWDNAKNITENIIGLNDETFIQTFELVYDQLQNKDYWKINLDFIIDLSNAYFAVLMRKAMGSF